MPNRILREGILSSERVNCLNWEQEVFYRRLISVVDDYGRYFAHPALLRAALYPLKLDQVREVNVERLISACEKARLVRLYTVDGKRYLEVLDFRQQVRAKDSKFPHPPPDDEHMHSTCIADAQHMHTKTETETETKSESEAEATTRPRKARPATDHQKLVDKFLEIKGVSLSDKRQVSAWYRRHGKSASRLITEAGGIEYATAALEWGSRWLGEKGLSWTLDTIAKHLPTFAECGRNDALARKYGLDRQSVQYARELEEWLNSSTQ